MPVSSNNETGVKFMPPPIAPIIFNHPKSCQKLHIAAAVLICKLEFWILEHGIGSDEHLAHDSNQCHFLWFVVILD